MAEKWLKIEGSRNYEVSTWGRVRKRHRTRYFFIQPSQYGGYYISDGARKVYSPLASLLTDVSEVKPVDEILALNARDNCAPEYRNLPDTGKRKYVASGVAKTGKMRYDAPLATLRECNTCGELTYQWRCEECWAEINARNGIEEDMGHPDDYYGQIGR